MKEYEYAENMKEYRSWKNSEISRILYELWDLEEFRAFPPYIGSGPLYCLWDLKIKPIETGSRRVRVVVYSFLLIYRLWDLENFQAFHSMGSWI